MQKKRILLLNNRVPFPVKDGGALATHSIIDSFNNLGFEVDLFFLNTQKHYLSFAETQKQFPSNDLTLVDIDTELKVTGAIKSILSNQSYNVNRFDDANAHAELTTLLKEKEYDAVHFESIYTAPYLKTIRKYSKAKCVLRTHNLEHEIWNTLANQTKSYLKKAYLKYLAGLLCKYEKRMMPLFDGLIPISPTDQKWMEQYASSQIKCIPTAVNTKSTKSVNTGKKFFHLGSMEWMPNIEGVKYLVEEVWPLVTKIDSAIELHLAGKGMGERFKKWENKQITVHGEVENATNFMQNYNSMIIPLKSASGLRIKALEAMSLSIPIVSTTVGLSGLQVHHEQEVLIADNKQLMAETIVKLANNSALQQELAANAYSYFHENFSESAINDALIQFYERIFAL